MSPRAVGEWGERVAAHHLRRSGWTIVERNFRLGRKEIDLIARRERVLAFIEVKARRGGEFGHPLSAIVARKRSAIREVAEAWVARFGEGNLEYRFDAVSVIGSGTGRCRVQHVENAWGF